MSHQIVITFDLDENRVAENAEKEAGRQIARQVIDGAFRQKYNMDAAMAKYVQNAIKEILAPEKERIISEAIKEVVGGLSRSKIVREKLAEALEVTADGKEGS